MRKSPLDQYLVLPIKKFIEKQTSVGILLIFAALLAMLVANSPLAEAYHQLWEQHIHIGINDLSFLPFAAHFYHLLRELAE